MRLRWVPLLTSMREVISVDERSPGALDAVEAFFHHHARVTKLLVYTFIVWLLVPSAERLWALSLLTLEGATASQEDHGLKIAYNDDVTPRRSLKWLSALGEVRHLDLTKTNVSDHGFAEIEANPKLRVLEVWETALSPRIHPSLSRFPGLVKLDLESVPLGSLRGFPLLRDLQVLDLTKTGIHDEDLAALARLTQLQELDLDENPITGTGLRHLAELSSLTQLDLDRTPLTDEGLENMPVLPNLKVLLIQNEKRLRGHGLRQVSNFRSLRRLSIAFSTVDGENLRYLSSLTNLEEFRAPGVPIGSVGLQPFAALRNVRSLYLGGMGIADADLVHLMHLQYLETLFVPANPKITLAGIKPLLALQSLKNINIDDTALTPSDQDAIRATRPDIKFQHLR